MSLMVANVVECAEGFPALVARDDHAGIGDTADEIVSRLWNLRGASGAKPHIEMDGLHLALEPLRVRVVALGQSCGLGKPLARDGCWNTRTSSEYCHKKSVLGSWYLAVSPLLYHSPETAAISFTRNSLLYHSPETAAVSFTRNSLLYHSPETARGFRSNQIPSTKYRFTPAALSRFPLPRSLLKPPVRPAPGTWYLAVSPLLYHSPETRRTKISPTEMA